MSIDRHRPGYFLEYHNKMKSDAIKAYGSKCACEHCVLHRDNLTAREIKRLKLFLTDKKSYTKGLGRSRISRHLKIRGYPKDAAILLCPTCYLGKHYCKHKQYSDKYLKLKRYFRKQKYKRRKI
jgi:hypothetical protein